LWQELCFQIVLNYQQKVYGPSADRGFSKKLFSAKQFEINGLKCAITIQLVLSMSKHNMIYYTCQATRFMAAQRTQSI
jgi:hypothetical protein